MIHVLFLALLLTLPSNIFANPLPQGASESCQSFGTDPTSDLALDLTDAGNVFDSRSEDSYSDLIISGRLS